MHFVSHISLSIFAISNVVGNSIYILALFLWLLPLFRQANERFFYYFYILAISQSVAIIVYYFWKLHPNYVFTTASYLLTLTIFRYNKMWQKNLLVLNSILFMVGLANQHNYASYVGAFYHVQMLGFFIALFIKKYFTRDIIYLYIFMLVVYEFSTTIMFSLKFVHSRINVLFANMLSLFEIFICAFFIAYNFRNSPKIYLSRQKKSVLA